MFSKIHRFIDLIIDGITNSKPIKRGFDKEKTISPMPRYTRGHINTHGFYEPPKPVFSQETVKEKAVSKGYTFSFEISREFPFCIEKNGVFFRFKKLQCVYEHLENSEL